MGLEKEGWGAWKGKFGEGGVEREELLGEIAMCCSHCLRRRHRLMLTMGLGFGVERRPIGPRLEAVGGCRFKQPLRVSLFYLSVLL